MKLLIRTILIFAISAGLLAGIATAQRKSRTKSSQEEGVRGLFVNKRADAMSILVLKLDGGALVPVSPSHEFKKGDQIKIEFESNFDGNIYVVNIQPSGKRRVLFPYADVTDNSVRANQRYSIPPGGDMMEFDEEQGTEVLQVIMSKDRIASFDSAIKDSDGWLAETASSAAAELQGGITNKDVTPALADEDKGRIRSRDIILAGNEKNKEKEGSVVAIQDKNGSGGKLKNGEVAPFEIRLKHN
jgi:hypothetical protein